MLRDPEAHVGRVYELTGPRSQDMARHRGRVLAPLGRRVTYVDVPSDTWAETLAAAEGISPHLQAHLTTMARLHRSSDYDRATATVATLTGRPAQTVAAFVAEHAEIFTAAAPAPGR